jgi:hypothetical protein
MNLWQKYQGQIPTSIFRNDGNLALILQIFLNELQIAYTAVQFVHLLTSIPQMFGQQLDNIGEIVGQVRQGLTDAQYQPILQTALIAASSRGDRFTILSILKIMGYSVIGMYDGSTKSYFDGAKLLDATTELNGYTGEGAFTVNATGTGDLQGLLNLIKAAGVAANVE